MVVSRNEQEPVRCTGFIFYKNGSEALMQIVEMNLDELRPYSNNPRNNDSAVGPVANSIKEFGFKVPIVATSDGEIIKV